MKIFIFKEMSFKEMSLKDFEPWSGAVYTYEKLKELDLLDQLEWILEDCYLEGINEETLNDILWFEGDWIAEVLGIKTYDKIQNEIEEEENWLKYYQDKLTDLLNDPESDPDDIEMLRNEILERKERIEILEEESQGAW